MVATDAGGGPVKTILMLILLVILAGAVAIAHTMDQQANEEYTLDQIEGEQE